MSLLRADALATTPNDNATHPQTKPHDWQEGRIPNSPAVGKGFSGRRITRRSYFVFVADARTRSTFARSASALHDGTDDRYVRSNDWTFRCLWEGASDRFMGGVQRWRVLGTGTARCRLRWFVDHWQS